MRRNCLLWFSYPLLGSTAIAFAADACRSGLEAGQRPGPYAALSTGHCRGQSFCFICETHDKPAVVIFARNLSDPLQADAPARSSDDRSEGGRFSGLGHVFEQRSNLTGSAGRPLGAKHDRPVPVGIFEDVDGPPTCRLLATRMTVIFFVKNKVTANFAFRIGELTDVKTDEVMKRFP